MVITTRGARLTVALSLLSLTLVSVSSYSEQTKDWDISPSLQAGFDYSSNLELTPRNETESFISRLTPGVDISRQGRYLTLDAVYQLQLINYSASNRSDEHFHRLNAFADAELVEDHLFVNTRATASQRLIDNRDAGIGDPAVAPDNVTNSLSFALAPTWRQRIGDYTNISVSASYDTVLYQTGAEDSEGVNYNLLFDTRNNPNKIYWTLAANQDTAKPSNGTGTLSQQDSAQAQLGYRHSNQLDLRFGGGYNDEHIDNPTDTDVDPGAFWSAGLTWNASPRSTLNLNYSDQIQSNMGRGLVFNHRRKYSSWSLSYQQSLSSVRDEFLQFTSIGSMVCPAGNSFNLTDCRFIAPGDSTVAGSGEQVFGINTLVPSLNEGQFISDALNANFSYRRSKTTLSIGLFGNRRKFQDLSNREERDLGFSAAWKLTLAARSTADISYNWSVLEPDSNDLSTEHDYRQGVTIGLTRNFSQDASMSVALRFNQRRSDDTSRQYQEYGAGINFNQSF